MDIEQAGLGTLLRALLDQLDPAVELAYAPLPLEYRPRFTPVVRALRKNGPSRIKDIAHACGLSHSALSQTVTAMARAGWIRVEPGADARERILSLTQTGGALVPQLERQWARTALAARSLDAELGVPLEGVLRRALAALQVRSFETRLADAGRAGPGAPVVGPGEP